MGGGRGLRWVVATAMTALVVPTGAAGAQQDAGRPVDGIAAIVNEEIISIGELERAARWLAGRPEGAPATGCGGIGARALEPEAAEMAGETTPSPPGAPRPSGEREPPLSPDDPELLERTLQCLIDGALVFREMRRFPQIDVTRSLVLESYDRLVDSWASPEAFAAELHRQGLTAEELRRDLRRQLLVSAYVDSRFRATIDVGEVEARGYFEETLAPDMRSRGIEPPAYEAVAEEFVIPILRERELTRRVESWIGDLRARADIEIRYPERHTP